MRSGAVARCRQRRGPVRAETSYYLAPEDQGNAGTPAALFRAALNDSKRDAIAKVAMHHREHIVLIRPTEDGLLLHLLYYADELNRPTAGNGQPV